MNKTQKAVAITICSKAREEERRIVAIKMIAACVEEAQKICGPNVLVLFMEVWNEGDGIAREVPDSHIEKINEFVGPNYKLVKVEDE